MKVFLIWPLLSLLAILPLFGCSNHPEHVQAILRVHRGTLYADEADFRIYRETQAALIKSPVVLDAAVRSDSVKTLEGVNRQKLATQMEVATGDTELIAVRLPCREWNAEQATLIVNAVIQAYFDEVVEVERHAKHKLLTKNRAKYTDAFHRLRETSEAYVDGAKAAALNRSVLRRIGTLREDSREYVISLRQRIVDLKLQRIDAIANSKAAESSRDPFSVTSPFDLAAKPSDSKVPVRDPFEQSSIGLSRVNLPEAAEGAVVELPVNGDDLTADLAGALPAESRAGTANNKCALIDEKIELLQRLILDELNATLRAPERASQYHELEGDLLALRTEMKGIRRAIEKLEAELGKPPTVSLVQSARLVE